MSLPSASVLLVHGAIVNGWELLPLRRRLAQRGYHVRQFYYQSMLKSMEENVRLLRACIASTPGEILHVIGHSMGGILLRHAFESEPDPRPGRLVAIGSPFLDCWVARRARLLHPRGHLLLGRTVSDHIAQPVQPLWRGSRELGVLAGTFPFGIGCVFPGLPRPSDGVILWSETRLAGIAEHSTIRLNHFGMLFSRRCEERIARFLTEGKFQEADGARPPLLA